MNHHFVPDWSVGDDIGSLFVPTSNHLNSMVSDNELIELLWSNGHVIMHNQVHRRPPVTVTEFKQSQKSEPTKGGGSLGNSNNLTLGDETVSWFQYSLGDSLEKNLCTEFLSELQTVDATVDDKVNKNAPADKDILGKSVFKQSDHLNKKAMPPPKLHGVGSVRRSRGLGNDDIVKCSHFSKPLRTDLVSSSGQFGQKGLRNGIQVGLGETSTTSVCVSNQVPILLSENQTLDNAKGSSRRTVNEDSRAKPRDGAQTNACGTTLTTSGGPGCGFGGTRHKIYSSQRHKRKGRDCEEPECHSEESEYRFGEANKTDQQSASACRSRATEVHNLSERKIRDKINEKMRALQELIPHCNKSDKTAMLDEAIKYLKSLKLQVQMMWMGNGIAPMMFPGVQQYMSSIGMGMAQSPMPYMHTPSPLPSVPPVNQFMPSATIGNYTPMCPPSGFSQVNFPPQMQNVHLPELQAQYLGFHHMQLSPQAINLSTLGSQGLLQNQPSLDGPVSEKIQNGAPGNSGE